MSRRAKTEAELIADLLAAVKRQGKWSPRVIPRAASTVLLRTLEQEQAARKAAAWERLFGAEARARIALGESDALQAIRNRHRETKDTITKIQYQVRLIHRHCWANTAALGAAGIDVDQLLGRMETIEKSTIELVVVRFEACADQEEP